MVLEFVHIVHILVQTKSSFKTFQTEIHIVLSKFFPIKIDTFNAALSFHLHWWNQFSHNIPTRRAHTCRIRAKRYSVHFLYDAIYDCIQDMCFFLEWNEYSFRICLMHNAWNAINTHAIFFDIKIGLFFYSIQFMWVQFLLMFIEFEKWVISIRRYWL